MAQRGALPSLSRAAADAWLSAVHCHVGSQGCEMSLLVCGARAVLDLAEQANERVRQIGGAMQVHRLCSSSSGAAMGMF